MEIDREHAKELSGLMVAAHQLLGSMFGEAAAGILANPGEGRVEHAIEPKIDDEALTDMRAMAVLIMRLMNRKPMFGEADRVELEDFYDKLSDQMREDDNALVHAAYAAYATFGIYKVINEVSSDE